MENINLNLGGLLGALVCGGIAAAVLFTQFENPNGVRNPAKLVVGAVIGGAVAGNFLWSKIFPRKSADMAENGSVSRNQTES